MNRTLWLVLLMIITLLTGVLAIAAKSIGDESMMKFMGIIAALCLFAFGVLALINGQMRKERQHKQMISAIQKLPRR